MRGKVTPGPWEATNQPGGGHPDNWHVIRRFDVGLNTEHYRVLASGLCETDALKMAAAPELLEEGRALEEALHAYLQGNNPNKAERLSYAIDAHRAALAKAEGR